MGASGQVGAQFLSIHRFLSRGEELVPSGRREQPGWLHIDLASMDAARIAKELDSLNLSAVYTFAGMTNVDACEDRPSEAFQSNAYGPACLAAYARNRAIPFVYFSTEYVFDGHAEHPGPYQEDDLANPLNVYGASKLAGEIAVAAAHESALIIRTTVVYGEDPQEKNYLYTVLRQLAAGCVLRVPQDQVSTPTYNRDLIQATIGLVDAGASGIFHICGPELLGRLEFARKIATHFQLDASLLHGRNTDELGQRAQRPLAAGLATDKLRSLFPRLVPRGLAACLQDCMTNLEPFVQSIARSS